MKKVLSSLTVLFAAALLIYSCNPIDEGQLPPSNTSQMTVEQATQLLQGTWYLHKVESLDGPACAGGPNETRVVHTYDMQYAGFRIDFTENPGGVDQLYGLPTNEMYYNGLSSTIGYNVLSADDVYSTFTFLPGQYDVQPDDIFLNFQYMVLEGRYITRGVIVSLTSDELVFLSSGDSYGLYYFKRTNQNSLPYNEQNLNGSFVIDGYKEVNSGVVDVNQTVVNGSTYSFTNTVVSNNKELRYKGESITVSVIGNPYLNLADYEAGSFLYEVSDTHIYTEGPSYTGGYVINWYKIQQLNNTELILRQNTNCNTYKEYHLTKVN